MSQLTKTPIPLTREAKPRLPESPAARHAPQPHHDACSTALRQTPARDPALIAVRHVRAGGRLVPIELLRNEGGSVAARLLIGSGDTPVIDAASADEALARVKDVIDGVLFARRGGSA